MGLTRIRPENSYRQVRTSCSLVAIASAGFLLREPLGLPAFLATTVSIHAALAGGDI